LLVPQTNKKSPKEKKDKKTKAINNKLKWQYIQSCDSATHWNAPVSALFLGLFCTTRPVQCSPCPKFISECIFSRLVFYLLIFLFSLSPLTTTTSSSINLLAIAIAAFLFHPFSRWTPSLASCDYLHLSYLSQSRLHF
jgi:hypothetical protein